MTSAQNRKKFTPPSCPQNVRTGSLLPPCLCGHTINFERSFLHQKVWTSSPQNVRTGQIPLSSDYGRILWTATKTAFQYKFLFT